MDTVRFQLDLKELDWAIHSQYIFAAGTTGVLWDYVLTFGDEVRCFWRPRSWSFVSVLFLASRYTTLLGSVFILILTSGTIALTEQTCHVLLVTDGIFVILGIASSHAIVALRVFALWDHRKHAAKILWSIFAVTYSCVFAVFVVYLKTIFESIALPHGFPMCIISRRIDVDLGAWISLLIFNIFTILLIISSALEKPYRKNKDVVDRLKREGCVSLVILTVTCTLNLALQAINPQHFMVVFVTVWLVDNSVLSRLVLSMEGAKAGLERERSSPAGHYLLTNLPRPK